MSCINVSAPYVGKNAFDAVAGAYVSFPTQSDAMVASLLLSHAVSYHTMNVLLRLINQPDFNNKELSLNSSLDILQIAEKGRLEKRSADVQKRSLNNAGQMIQTRFPQFVLSEVLEILEKEREVSLFGRLHGDLEFRQPKRGPSDYDNKQIFYSLSLVHRSWTHLAQKSLARIAYPLHNYATGRNHLNILQGESPPAIYGPWTTTIVLMRANVLVPEPWQIKFLAMALLRLPNKLEYLILQTERRASYTRAVVEIDCFIDNGALTSELQYLSLKDGVYRGQIMRADFSSLRGLRIMCSSGDTVRTFVSLLSSIASHPNSPFESLAILDINSESVQEMESQKLYSRCSSIWPRLSHLRLGTQSDPEGYHKCERSMEPLYSMVPLCTELRKLGFTYDLCAMPDLLLSSSLLPPTIEELEVQITARNYDDFLVEPEEWDTDFLSELALSGWSPVLHTIRLRCPSVPPTLADSLCEYGGLVKYEDLIPAVTERARMLCRSMHGDLIISWYNIQLEQEKDI